MHNHSVIDTSTISAHVAKNKFFRDKTVIHATKMRSKGKWVRNQFLHRLVRCVPSKNVSFLEPKKPKLVTSQHFRGGLSG